MLLSGHTDLDRLPDLPPQTRQRLRAMWIDSVEEYVALLGAVGESSWKDALGTPSKSIAASRRMAETILGAPRAAALSQPRPGGSLGCLIDPEVLATVKLSGSVNPRRQRMSAVDVTPLPPAIRLMDRLPPPRDQGGRGTCVAFASTALREFLTGRNAPDPERLCEQFLYWACKEIDGLASSGTYIRTAMTALGRLGICRAATWPYNPAQLEDNEAQGPPPDAATEEARDFRMLDNRTVEPSLVDQYKRILAGNADVGGMPVAFSVIVYNSWMTSAETRRTGKINMPLPGEPPMDSGHAMCIVGYADDATAPGGGYFIVRNSWGTTWADQSPEAPGHALFPYDYVERFSLEAFTGPAGNIVVQAFEPAVRVVEQPPVSHVESPAVTWSDHNAKKEQAGKPAPQFAYLRRLDQAARDLEGMLHKTGATVLANPIAPHEFLADSPANRKTFAEIGYAWTVATRAAVWLPQRSAWSEKFVAQLASVEAVRQRFFAAIDENLKSAVGEPFPHIRPPALARLLGLEPHVKSVVEAADLTEDLSRRLRNKAGVPADVTWPAEWEQVYRSVATAKVYRVESGSSQGHVIVGFATPILIDAARGPDFQSPDASTREALQQTYVDWCKKNESARPRFGFFTCSSAEPWAGGVEGTSAGDSWFVCSSAATDAPARPWNISAPPRVADRAALRDFMDRLTPETRQERISKVKSIVDDLIASGYAGNIHVAKLSKEAGCQPTAVRDAMAALQDSGNYRVYRTADGDPAIARADYEGGVAITSQSLRRPGRRGVVFTLLVPALALSVLLLEPVILSIPIHAGVLLAVIPLAYAGWAMDRRLKK